MFLTGSMIGFLACALIGTAENVAADDISAGKVTKLYSFEPDEDMDYDGMPDDWIRRKGPAFPRYVKIGIDCAHGCVGEQSLRFDTNGGAAILYSPPVPIDALHTYRFQGKIRTKDLKHDAAVISISLLNYRRQRIQRFLTPVVTSPHEEWQTVEIKTMIPHKDVKFVSVGCHLLTGDEPGIGGSVWFDDLVLTQSPRLEIDNETFVNFWTEDSPVIFKSKVSGLEPDCEYSLIFEYFDADGQSKQAKTHQLTSGDTPATGGETAPRDAIQAIEWDLGLQDPGYYRLTAKLLQGERLMLYEETSLAVMRLVEKPRIQGEFGWSIKETSQQLKSVNLENLVRVGAQAGINWIKFPVWNSVRSDNREYTRELAEFFDRLDDYHIRTIGMLNDPPPELRAKFARNRLGVSEIFSSQHSVWGPTIEPVVARFSSTIRHWQLGDEEDSSFEGLSDLEGTLGRVSDEINRIGLNSQLGIAWKRDHALPPVPHQTLGFISLRETETLTINEMHKAWSAPGNSRTFRWIVLQPSTTQAGFQQRASHLSRQMIAAKMAKVDGIFISHVFEGRNGLLNPDGSPSDLFLPWRTVALALQNAEYLGKITLPNKSQNAVFAREGDDEAILFVWNDPTENAAQPEVTETFYFGENVTEMDLWGRSKPAKVVPHPKDPAFKEQVITVTNIPKILRGCSESVARWRLATAFEIGEMRSEYGSHQDAVLGSNEFKSGVSGKVFLETPSREHKSADSVEDELDLHSSNASWQAEPREWTLAAAADERFRLPVFLTLPTDASLGDSQMKLTFQIVADRPYRFQVLCPYHVGSGDVTLKVMDRMLEDGRLEIEQVVINSTLPPEVLDFRCSLLVPGRPRQKARVTRLAANGGEDRKFYYLSDAENLKGKELRLKLEQEGGGRILNHKWTVGTHWKEDVTDTASKTKERSDIYIK